VILASVSAAEDRKCLPNQEPTPIAAVARKKARRFERGDLLAFCALSILEITPQIRFAGQS